MGVGCGGVGRGRPRWGPGLLRGVPVPPALLMQGMGSLRLGSRAVMYTVETLPKGKNRVMGVSFGGDQGEKPPQPIPGGFPVIPQGMLCLWRGAGIKTSPIPRVALWAGGLSCPQSHPSRSSRPSRS